MTKEFTFLSFKNLLLEFKKKDYEIVPFINSLKQKKSIQKQLILRHDVDRFPKQTLEMAILENAMGVRSTYFFRTIPSVFQHKIISKVVELGHEIGYHYEDLTLCKGNYEKAIKHFEDSLNKIRKYYPVRTICMHGSPLSPWDNKKIWEKYKYEDYGIVADTSFDINYNDFFYITDNGFGWNKTSTSVRDKVKTKFNIPINNTEHLIHLIKTNELPANVMLNAHPDTFFNPGIKWFLNYSFIKSKNIVKWFIVKAKIFN